MITQFLRRITRRTYSVAEIDEMRLALYKIYSDFSNPNYEEKLRTYMLNGTSPRELQEKAEKVGEFRKEHGFYHDV